MSSKIVDRILDMGYDPTVTVEEIDQFVDECIDFLIREATPEQNFKSDIYDLESARQKALVVKFSTSNQPE